MINQSRHLYPRMEKITLIILNYKLIYTSHMLKGDVISLTTPLYTQLPVVMILTGFCNLFISTK